jgi:hypothetical protein
MRGPAVSTALVTASLGWSLLAFGQPAGASDATSATDTEAPEPSSESTEASTSLSVPAAPVPPKPETPAAPPKPPQPGPRRDTLPTNTEPDAWQAGHALAVEALVRGSSRLGDASVNSDAEERAGLGFDLGAWFTLSPEYLVGFGLKRVDLGHLSLDSGLNGLNAGYATTALTLGARAFPWRRYGGEIFVGLEVGLAWQDVDATGLRQPQNAVLRAEPFSCSGGSGPGLELGAEVGTNLRLTRALWFTASFDASAYRLSNEVIGECVVGLGSVTAVSLGAGLLYAFDIGSR